MLTDYDQGDEMPAWAAAMERRLTRQMVEITEDLKDDLASINDGLASHLTSIDGRLNSGPLNGMTSRLIGIETNAARTINFSCGDGTCWPYELVPASDGKYLHNLPELRTAQDLRNLTDVQLDRYLKGYGLEHGHGTARNEKLALLCRYIGGSLE
ncbi:hypothetical protein ARMSODRAFT_955435 [Armillaria solidipes]|uniref:Mug135-like C-terminal domain-containing protein n=1 Tax=Armillaria solidipes TaxID=1076256 RepID=A0A2H3BP43_9AGAR|nr:hypothetical protein ARMSODRAFT_955435 [Armillaria solidipes]